MPTVSLQYEFRQPFRASAGDAFAWCTDYRPSDAALFPKKWERSVRWITPDALVLTDVTFPSGRRRVIQRLVRIDAAQRTWTNTHLTGPFRHSQYWYRVVPDGGKRSHLHFTGSRLLTVRRKLPASAVASLTRAERAEDATLWRRYLAPALERDVRRSASR